MSISSDETKSSIGFGIDFGTTNSIVSAFNGRRINSFTDENKLPHPSVIWFRGDEEEPVIGREAKKNMRDYSNEPGHKFVRSIKSRIQEQKEIEIFGKVYYNTEIASKIFQFLRRDVQNRFSTFPDLSEAVVTIPLYFGGRQRRAIRRAAELAGIRVKTFIHEPFAAVIGYLFEKYQSLEKFQDLRKNIVVFDWGGGTLDITLVQVADGRINELGNAGFPNRAGDHFDEMLMNYLIGQFQNENNISSEDFLLSSGVAGIFQNDVEFAKIELSDDDRSSINIFDFFSLKNESHDFFYAIRKEEFESIIREDVEDALRNLMRVLNSSDIDITQIHEVLLVGGTSKIPLLRELVYELFGIAKVIPIQNSSTLISEGAAIISFYNWQPYLVNPLCVQLSDDTLFNIFDSGDLLNPNFAQKEITFFCTDNRSGEAHLIVSEQQDLGKSKEKTLLSVPVSKTLQDIYKEKINSQFFFDEDLVFTVSARGSIKGEVRQAHIHDVCYGLRFA